MDALQAIPSLYEADYLQWLMANLEKLRNRDYEQVDWDNLLEEIEDMGRREKRAIESNFVVLLLHLLKWQYQPEKRSGSWERSILEHRRRINRALQDSPSLKPYCLEVLPDCYAESVKQARAETQLPLATFPATCPYSLAFLLQAEFPA